MICPQCQAEYREGFTVCADCGAQLIAQLPAPPRVSGSRAGGPAESENREAPGDAENPFCAFWEGDDARIHAELCTVLEEAGIPYKTMRREDYLFRLTARSAFKIGVPFSLYETAERVVASVYGKPESEPETRWLPPETNHLEVQKGLRWSTDDSSVVKRLLDSRQRRADQGGDLPEEIPAPRGSARRTGGEPENWHPEDATVLVWSGNELEGAEFRKLSLRENEIYCRSESNGQQQSLYVLPPDEGRAREIVREVGEASLPSESGVD
jgi:hypothetical protein